MRTRAIATIGSALLAVSLVSAPVMAQEGSTAIDETLTVRPLAQCTVEVWLPVSPATGITYGPVVGIEPGAEPVLSAPNPATQGRVMSVGAGTIVDIDLHAADFTSVGLPDLGKNIREVSPWTTNSNVWPASKMTLAPEVAGTQDWFLSSFINNLSPLYSTAGFACDDTSTSHWCPFAVSTQVSVPADAAAGDYGSTLEWTVDCHY